MRTRSMLDQHERTLLNMIGIGVAVGIGRLLLTTDPVTWRVLIGRSLVGGTTAMIAGAVLALLPDLPQIAIYGLASLAGHLGAEGVMKLAGDYLNRKRET